MNRELIDKQIGEYTITENMLKAFDIINQMPDCEKEAFFAIILWKAKQEEEKAREEIEKGLALLSQKMNERFSK